MDVTKVSDASRPTCIEVDVTKVSNASRPT